MKSTAMDPIRALLVALLEQAVVDYVALRELGFVHGIEVKGDRLKALQAVRPRYSPNGYFTTREMEELVNFLDSHQFTRLCSLVGEKDRPWPAAGIRRAIGLWPGAEKFLALDDLWWIVTPRCMRARSVATAHSLDPDPSPDPSPDPATLTSVTLLDDADDDDILAA